MFKSGSLSGCFTAGENQTLSPLDIQGLQAAYPQSQSLIESRMAAQEQVLNSLNAVAEEEGSSDLRLLLKNRREMLPAINK